MSIERLITKLCVQDAVYWGSPQPDGTGGYTFDAPVEIKVRWSETTKVIETKDGEKYVCIAEILLLQDVDRGGYLLLGTTDDFDSDDGEDPVSLSGAYKIQRFDKIPLIRSTTKFVRTAYI